MEKSKDEIDFSELGKVAGAGNSSTVKNYEAEFPAEDLDYTYYRLKQTDFDGNFKYSDVIHVTCNSNFYDDVLLYPNPSNNQANIKFNLPVDTKIIYSVVDVFGREVKRGEFIAATKGAELTMDTENFPAGVYFIKLNSFDNGISFPALKFVKQ